MKKTTKKVRKVLIITVGVILVGWAFLLIVERMPFGFITTIDVTNNLDEDVYITPVGQIRGSDGFVHLRNQNESFKFSIPESYHILLKSGERTRINYDMDDIAFKFFVIETKDGEYYVKAAGSPFNDIDEVHTIDDLQKLEYCPDEFIPCTKGKLVDLEDK